MLGETLMVKKSQKGEGSGVPRDCCFHTCSARDSARLVLPSPPPGHQTPSSFTPPTLYSSQEAQLSIYRRKEKLRSFMKGNLLDSPVCCHVRNVEVLELKYSQKVN